MVGFMKVGGIWKAAGWGGNGWAMDSGWGQGDGQIWTMDGPMGGTLGSFPSKFAVHHPPSLGSVTLCEGLTL